MRLLQSAGIFQLVNQPSTGFSDRAGKCVVAKHGNTSLLLLYLYTEGLVIWGEFPYNYDKWLTFGSRRPGGTQPARGVFCGESCLKTILQRTTRLKTTAYVRLNINNTRP